MSILKTLVGKGLREGDRIWHNTPSEQANSDGGKEKTPKCLEVKTLRGTRLSTGGPILFEHGAHIKITFILLT